MELLKSTETAGAAQRGTIADISVLTEALAEATLAVASELFALREHFEDTWRAGSGPA